MGDINGALIPDNSCKKKMEMNPYTMGLETAANLTVGDVAESGP